MDTITLKRGAPFHLAIDGKDENGAAYPIPADWAAVANLCFSRPDGPLAAALSPQIVAGRIVMEYDTALLEPASYVFDIKLLNAAGEPIDVTENVMLIIEPSPSTP